MFDVVYLSPHLDDAVLSCGGRIAREIRDGRKVGIVTIFTADEPKTAPSKLAADLRRWWKLPAGEVMTLRRREDERACARLGTGCEHWGFPEAPYRLDAAARPLYGSLRALFGGVRPEDELLAAALGERISAQFLARENPPRLVGPLAVGGHVDHQIVRRALERALPAPWLFEEFPYAEWKWGALRKTLGRKSDWASDVVALGAGELATRIEAIAEYGSQVEAMFRGTSRLAKQIRRAARRAGGERLWRRKGDADA